MTDQPVRLAVALDGAGWHPAAAQQAGVTPAQLLTARYWAGLALEAEHGGVDLITLEDSLTPPVRRPDGARGVPGRLDAGLIAARIAPVTSTIGLVPTVTTQHTEPFHVSTAIATLDYASHGRAGWRVQLGRPAEASHFGRRSFPADPRVHPELLDDLLAEAGDAVEVVRRLWDSWDADAIIRDLATSRFVDRDKLHYIDFEGRWFSVKGPSITPRPPQGQPVVVALAHSEPVYRFAARSADVVFVTPQDAAQAAELVTQVKGYGDVQVWADLVVVLGGTTREAQQRLAQLDSVTELTSDAAVVTGSAGDLVSTLLEWREAGVEGFRLRPAVLPHDLQIISRDVVPLLRERGASGAAAHPGTTLRNRLGLGPAVSRYAAAEVA